MRKVQFAPNNVYHIYNRGVDKRTIFLDDNDRWRFLQALFLFNDVKTSTNALWEIERSRGAANFSTIKDYFSENYYRRDPIVKIMADCLMPNHYHLIIEEIQEGGISRFMHKFGTGFTMYFNQKYKRSGALFQGPFKAIPVDDQSYLEYLLVYINVINPGQLIEPNLKENGVEDMEKILDFARSYLWSTHREYLQIRDSTIIDKGLLGDVFPSGRIYEEFVKSAIFQKNKFDNIKYLLLE
jgi:putative transposase